MLQDQTLHPICQAKAREIEMGPKRGIAVVVALLQAAVLPDARRVRQLHPMAGVLPAIDQPVP